MLFDWDAFINRNWGTSIELLSAGPLVTVGNIAGFMNDPVAPLEQPPQP